MPIEPEQAALTGQEFRRALGQRLVRSSVLTSRLNAADPPIEDVANRRLTRFQAVETGEYGFRHDPAKAWDVTQFPLHRADHDVAGRCADDLDQRPGIHARADRAKMRIERAHSDRNALWQAEFRRPFR